MSVTPYPTLRLKLTVPQALKMQFLPAIPGFNASQAAALVQGAVSGPDPGFSEDNHIALWDGASGRKIKNSHEVSYVQSVGQFTNSLDAGPSGFASYVVRNSNAGAGAGAGFYAEIGNGASAGQLYALGDGLFRIEVFTGHLRLKVDDAGKNIHLATNGGAILGFSAFEESAVALVDGATVPLNANLGNVFSLTALGNRTILAPTNAPASGLTQKLIISHLASGANRTLALTGGAGGFRFGSTITGLTATISGTTDYIGSIWNGNASRWDVVAYAKGF